MFDYRLYHAGEPNLSEIERPVLSIVYHRAWFRDASNFDSQAPLQILTKERAKIPDNFAHLFNQAVEIKEA